MVEVFFFFFFFFFAMGRLADAAVVTEFHSDLLER